MKTIPSKLVPTEPGEYFCQPFWNGKHQVRQVIECYYKKCLIDEEVGYRTELLYDYGGYSHLVALTGLNKWERGVEKLRR